MSRDGPFQRGESRVFRLAAGLEFNNFEFCDLATPDDWDDRILENLFEKSISNKSNISPTLTQIPDNNFQNFQSKK